MQVEQVTDQKLNITGRPLRSWLVMGLPSTRLNVSSGKGSCSGVENHSAAITTAPSMKVISPWVKRLMVMSENEFQTSYRYSDDVVGSFRPNQLAILRAVALMPRQILGNNQIISAMNAIRAMMNSTG